MASLSGGARIGNSNTSSLLKSANTLATEIATYKDAVAATNYASSAKTDADFQAYQDYLNGRIGSLQASGSVSNLTKAVGLTNTLRSATNSNVSASIQRENIQVMAGNATLQDKYNVVSSQFQRAVGVGDMSLAQSLESQAYSISQSIQYQAQVAADSATALGKAHASSTASGENNVATSLENALGQLNGDIKAAGKDKFLSTVNDWLKTNTDVLKSLGVSLDPSAKNADVNAKYFSIVNAVGAAKLNAYQLAYNALLPTDPIAAQSYKDKAMNLVSGKDKLPTLAGDLTREGVQQAVNSPAEFIYNNSTGALQKSNQSGVSFDYATNTVTPTFSGSVVNNGIKVLPADMVAQFAKLGLQQGNTTGDGVTVQATNKSPKWLQDILGTNGTADIYAGPNGTLQFKGSSANGQTLYTVSKDSSGKIGLLASDNTGDRIVGGDYGYNPNNNKSATSVPSGQSLHVLPNGKTDQMASIFQNPNNLVANAGIQQAQVAAANAAAAAAMLNFTPPPLPNISFNNAPPPAPITVSSPSAPQTRSISQAKPVASPAISPQNPGGINLQGGGGGIRLQ